MLKDLALRVALLTAVGMSSTSLVYADEPNAVRGAGNELRFRVIDRFGPSENAVDWPWSDEARSAFDRGAWTEAFGHVKAFKPDDPTHLFGWGYAAYQAGEYESALDALAKASSKSILKDYAALFAARAANELGQTSEARRWATQVDASTPIHADATWVLSRTLVDDEETFERALRGFIGTYGRHARVAQAKLELGDLLRKRDDKTRAAAVYYELLESHPLSSEASRAKASLDALLPDLDLATRRSVDPASSPITMARYEALFSAHRSDDVVDGLSSSWEKLEKDSRCRALYLIGRSLTKLRKHTASIPWYDRLLARCPNADWQRKGLYLAGRGAWNAGDRPAALGYFERLWTEHASHSYADDALYFAARIHRDEGRLEKARSLLEKQVREHPRGDMAKDAHWLVVRELIRNSNHSGVVAYVDSLETRPTTDLYSQGRLEYFRARALEESKKSADATKAYQDVVRDHPMSHYALFAMNRLRENEIGDTLCSESKCAIRTEKRPMPSSSEALESDVRYRRARALLGLELGSLARGELASLRASFAKDADRWRLAELLHQAGAYPISHDITRRHIEGWMDHYPTRGAEMWEIAFPRPYLEDVKRWAGERDGVDEALIYAIMREESGFSAGIESWANARGLMQLMEKTGKRMARKDGVNLTSNSLFDPEIGIRLGSAYLSELASNASGHPVVVMAGYNGGWGNVGRWLGESETRDLELWIEDIPYGQTRKYAKRVLQTYWAYSILYTDHSVPEISLRLPK